MPVDVLKLILRSETSVIKKWFIRHIFKGHLQSLYAQLFKDLLGSQTGLLLNFQL